MADSVYSSADPVLAILGVAFALFPTGVRADCWIDQFGDERCNLSTAARAGVAIGIFGNTYRQRRIAHANAAFIPTHNTAPPPPQPPYTNSNFGSPYNGGNSGYAPSYPPQSYGSPAGGYDPAAGFAPPTGPPPAHHADAPPPQYYPPPSGPPPFADKQ
ncbi:hypothetical protein FA95DRAFT_1569067 [Auriscalpium vulgare]|uniref:Uncharacterized protein n=1 Tax=Auriscalpium vulgare TaxID=40419 RepID=A0ACB8SA85_9AGAM|nr:hypothetical protein FA95DRAFT_1569067 [Auriscalpium vulgare]